MERTMCCAFFALGFVGLYLALRHEIRDVMKRDTEPAPKPLCEGRIARTWGSGGLGYAFVPNDLLTDPEQAPPTLRTGASERPPSGQTCA